MGTTLTTAYLLGNKLIVAHVGDSRAYLLRDGTVTCLTRDHTVVGDMVRLKVLTPDKIRTHTQRSVLTKGIGLNPFVTPDISQYTVKNGDALILCSDGLWSEVSNDVIKDALLEKNIENSLEELVGMVLNAGAPDNITGIVFRISEINGVDE